MQPRQGSDCSAHRRSQGVVDHQRRARQSGRHRIESGRHVRAAPSETDRADRIGDRRARCDAIEQNMVYVGRRGTAKAENRYLVGAVRRNDSIDRAAQPVEDRRPVAAADTARPVGDETELDDAGIGGRRVNRDAQCDDRRDEEG